MDAVRAYDNVGLGRRAVGERQLAGALVLLKPRVLATKLDDLARDDAEQDIKQVGAVNEVPVCTVAPQAALAPLAPLL
ncbi:MAG TPA: hypothetical protein VMG38_04595 [Trebonia sp.]|nr:hypothetical protein [Trebonia sp.]